MCFSFCIIEADSQFPDFLTTILSLCRWIFTDLISFQWSMFSLNEIKSWQEPITRSLQLPHIAVVAFSQTDLFLVWIYLEFSMTSTGTSMSNCNLKHGRLSTYCRHVHVHQLFFLPLACHVDWDWLISREKSLKIDWPVKMLLHWLMGVTGS